MKAMILAAGLGTRLRPLTDTIPKALVTVNGRTLLEQAMAHLRDYGIRQVIINVHHFADRITGYLRENHNFGMEVSVSDETSGLLDTGGGLKHAAGFFSEGGPFLVRNVDVLSDLDLSELARFHDRQKALATLVVRERTTSRYFLFTAEMELAGWKNAATGEEKITAKRPGVLKPMAFSGIQVVDPAIFPLMPEEGRFSLTELYVRLSAFQRIVAYNDTRSNWKDAGKP